jgi:hypothetical protein
MGNSHFSVSKKIFKVSNKIYDDESTQKPVPDDNISKSDKSEMLSSSNIPNAALSSDVVETSDTVASSNAAASSDVVETFDAVVLPSVNEDINNTVDSVQLTDTLDSYAVDSNGASSNVTASDYSVDGVLLVPNDNSTGEEANPTSSTGI